MHHTDWVQPLLLRLSGPEGPANRTPLRRFDPTCRLRGWRTLAEAVDRERDRLTAGGERAPVLAASLWWVPGELGVYCAGHPQAYSIGLTAGDRHSQYDLWINPLANGDQFRDRTFLIVGDVPEERGGPSSAWRNRGRWSIARTGGSSCNGSSRSATGSTGSHRRPAGGGRLRRCTERRQASGGRQPPDSASYRRYNSKSEGRPPPARP